MPALVAALGALLALAPAAGALPSYHSPGYKGKKRFSAGATAPLPSIILGTGKYPNLVVDDAGTAHIVYAQDGGVSAADTIFSCTLQRGQKRCANSSTVAAPQEPEGGDFAGNFPAGNHDFTGPAPLVIGNQLFIVDRRFPDAFPTPGGGTSDSNVFEWSSNDGGMTITGPGQIGDNQIGGGAIVYGSVTNPSIGTISDTETGGTWFQGSAAGQYTTAKAQLGTGDQAYYGSAAADGALPIATFADLSGNVFVREWSGQGDVDDASTWSTASFHGYAPQIIGGRAGVFVLYSDSMLNDANLFLVRIVAGRPSGAPVKVASAASQEAITEDASGRLSLAYVDNKGIEVRTSTNGVSFTKAALVATIPAGGSVGHLVAAAAHDGGGFVVFVRNPGNAEGVGTVVAAAFGTQRATGRPGLGPLPGGGQGSSVGDQLATSTCTTAKFGVVVAQVLAGCFAHDPKNPRLDVSAGEVDINGLRVIPDPGATVAIDPPKHTIDTNGNVQVVLSGVGIDVTIWHGAIHAKIPRAKAGDTLFDFHETGAPMVAGFPINGDVEVKLTANGAGIPVSLSLPPYFGGVTGSATLVTTFAGGLELGSLAFKIDDANFGGLELKNVAVSYTQQGNVWKGMATVEIPSGGSALSVSLAVEFDNGDFQSGSFDIGLPYPGVPIDLNDTPPQLYLTHGGLGLKLHPLTFSGEVGFGFSPLSAPGAGTARDFAFSLDGSLAVAFGNPVTITVTATGYVYVIKVAQAQLIYKIPDIVTLTGKSGIDLGIFQSVGTISAIIDPQHNVFGGQIRSAIVIDLPGVGGVTLPSQDMAINNDGFAVFVPPTVSPLYWGTVSYRWGDVAPSVTAYQDVVGQFTVGLPKVSADHKRAHAAAAVTGFVVPGGAPSASLIVNGTGGAPSVVLTAPNGQQITPAGHTGSGITAVAIPNPGAGVTDVGIDHPAAGQWTVAQAAGSTVPISSVKYAAGESLPVVHASVGGKGARRTFHYRVKLPPNTTVTFAESTSQLLHVIGTAKHAHGTIKFTPATGPAGRRQIIAMIDDAGLPLSRPTVASFVAPRPQRPKRARRLRVKAGHSFSIHFQPGTGWARTLLLVRATDGRHLQLTLPLHVHSARIPVIGFKDGITVTVVGLGANGRRGPGRSASARRKQ